MDHNTRKEQGDAFAKAWGGLAAMEQLCSFGLRNLTIVNRPDGRPASDVAQARERLATLGALLTEFATEADGKLDQFLRLTDPSVDE